MYQKITHLAVLELFIENTNEKYYLREAARLLKMSPMTLKRSLDYLQKENLILKTTEKNNIFYKANKENLFFKHVKISYNLKFLEKNNLIELILDKLPASSVVLYGSFARGENTKDSDIDILVISQKKENISLELLKKIKKEVNIQIFTQSEWIKQESTNKAFYIDVITDGIVLYGRRPVV
jgi:predicted nucleotidyltransferase